MTSYFVIVLWIVIFIAPNISRWSPPSSVTRWHGPRCGVWGVKPPINNIRIGTQIEAHCHLWRCGVVSSITDSHPMKWKAEHAGSRCLTAGTYNCNGHHPPHLHSLHTDMYLLKVNFCKTSNTDTQKYIPDIQNTELRVFTTLDFQWLQH